MGTNYQSPSATSTSYQPVNNYTLGQIVQQAYRLAGGLILAGQGINPSEQQEILDITNHFVDGLKLEILMFQFMIATTVAVQANKSVYSVGPGQDWDIERPEKIDDAGFVLQYNQGETESELPLSIVISFEQYKNIVAKQTQSSFPLLLYYQATTPYGSATLWPVPNVDSASDQGAYVRLYTPGYMQEFTSLDDPLIVPHGYREFMVYNLAIRIHQRPPYNKQIMDPSVTVMAAEYKTRIMDRQLTPILASSDPAVVRRGYGALEQPPRAWTPDGTN